MLNTRKHSPSSPKSPKKPTVVPRRNPRRATTVAQRRSPSPVVAQRRSPSPVVVPRRSPSRVVAQRRSPSPVVVPRRSPPRAKTYMPRRTPSRVVAQRDPYYTPFWPPSDYSVPAKIIVNDPNPLPRTLAKHKIFIEELRKILIIEKIIDRENPLFEKLLAEQQEWNHRFYNLKPYNIICFIKCDYYLHDKKAPRVFHRNNVPEPFFGNFKFLKLLGENNMGVKRLDNNILYIHKNRF